MFVVHGITQQQLCSQVGAKLKLGDDAQFAVLIEATNQHDHIILGDDTDVQSLLKPEIKLIVIADL